tara:strand:- start:1970 stop:3028 length:1059 start_codon:yes stop_codon:yes gene_type:complete
MTIYRTPIDTTSGPNCGPTSIATLTGKTLAEVMAYIRQTIGKGPNWKGSTLNPKWKHGETFIKSGDIFKSLEHFGANPILDAALNDRYQKCQIKTAAEVLPRDKAYLILTGGHAQACVDGRLFDQNTSEGGDEARAFWGRKKKVSLIVTVDRLPETKIEEPKPMTDAIPAIHATLPETTIFGLTAVAVAEHEAAFQSANGEAKGLRADANVSKIEAYSVLIPVIKIQNIKKGSKRAGELRAELEMAGVSKACAKRYMEIGQAAAKLPMLKNVADIAATLNENDIKTEAALKNVCFPTVEKSIVEKLVDAAKAGTDTPDEALQALLDAAAVINPAAQDVANTLVAAINRKVAA